MTQMCNAEIESVTIDDADRGFLTAWLHLNYGGSGQGFGGYTLYLPNSFFHADNQANFAGHFIWRCMEVGGVTRWNDLKGKTIRVEREDGWGGSILRVGHIVKDIWFDPKKEFEALMTLNGVKAAERAEP